MLAQEEFSSLQEASPESSSFFLRMDGSDKVLLAAGWHESRGVLQPFSCSSRGRGAAVWGTENLYSLLHNASACSRARAWTSLSSRSRRSSLFSMSTLPATMVVSTGASAMP